MINPISKLITTAERDDGEKIGIDVSFLVLTHYFFFLYLVIPAQDDSTVQQSAWDHIALFVKFSVILH